MRGAENRPRLFKRFIRNWQQAHAPTESITPPVVNLRVQQPELSDKDKALIKVNRDRISDETKALLMPIDAIVSEELGLGESILKTLDRALEPNGKTGGYNLNGQTGRLGPYIAHNKFSYKISDPTTGEDIVYEIDANAGFRTSIEYPTDDGSVKLEVDLEAGINDFDRVKFDRVKVVRNYQNGGNSHERTLRTFVNGEKAGASVKPLLIVSTFNDKETVCNYMLTDEYGGVELVSRDTVDLQTNGKDNARASKKSTDEDGKNITIFSGSIPDPLPIKSTITEEIQKILN